MNITDHIKTLGTYDYAETYSFRRGKDFLEAGYSYVTEKNRLERRRSNGKLISVEDNENLEKLRKQADLPLYILNERNELNPSSVRICSLKSNDAALNRLESILLSDNGDAPYWMCAPEYRDAIIFYNASANIISALDICFSCSRMRSGALELTASEETYKKLKDFLRSAGHPIEE